MTGLRSSTLQLVTKSIVEKDRVEYSLAQEEGAIKLVILADKGTSLLGAFEGETSDFDDRVLLIGQLNNHNASMLRDQIDWLKPKLLGLRTSAGMGDRLGIATPGHVRAVKETGGKVAPIFAQQSIREMTRTQRNPQGVVNDAMWGIFEEGWRGGFSADADHLKTTQDIDRCMAAGFVFYTIDPGEHVRNSIRETNINNLRELAGFLPASMQINQTGLLKKEFFFYDQQVEFDEAALLQAMVKYGLAINHVVKMYEHLDKEANGRPFEVEVSMDETEVPTTPEEHIYIASEMKRLGVKWVSFAPRFIGRFEKGVDYIGDVHAFEHDVGIHSAIARMLGPYKLSLHSGSDKFSIYSIFMEKTGGLAHLKTAGTSYLEAVKTIAQVDIDFFKEIYKYARQTFEKDKQSYLSSAQITNAPLPDHISEWKDALNQFDAREILHMTYGSVLTDKSDTGTRLFYDRFITILGHNRELYFKNLVEHFKRHLIPFSV